MVNPQRLVAVLQYGGSVGDEDNCMLPVLQDIAQETLFGVGIEGAGGFVEYHERAVSEKCSGYADALCLSLAQSPTLLGYCGIDTLGQFAHEVGAGRIESLIHLFLGGIDVTQQQVVANGAGEERVALRHVDDVAAGLGGSVEL